FKLNQTISEKEFAHKIISGLKRMKSPILYEWVPGGLETMSSKELLTRDQAALLLLVAISEPLSKIEEEGYYKAALRLELIPDYIQNEIIEDRLLNRKEAYIILAHLLEKYLPANSNVDQEGI
ncbi:MAG TPA: hypothetical protein VKY40_10090, partial [Halanaerobiales bacterium]|nr:hypothetical protein [Halanaerobiales bacterium]